MHESMILAGNIAEIKFEDIPVSVVNVTKKSVLDTLGVILGAGTMGEGCQAFVDLASAGGGKPESTIIGFGTKVPAVMAAFANGSMAHALDFEDACHGVHPSAPTVPAALAVAEALGNVSGRDLITAVTIGNDLVCRLALAQKVSLAIYGWFGPPILGSFGAAAAACKIGRLNAEQIVDAFSLNLCQATCSAELMDNPHSLIRSVRDAFSAKSGVLAALLAEKGVRGFDRPLEGKAGFFNLYARGNYDPSVLTAELGKVFAGAGVSFKAWPSCRGTHPYVDAVLQILRDDNLRLDNIVKIVAIIAPGNKMLCEPNETKRKPKTAIDAKFSIPFVVATALTYKAVALEHFNPLALQSEKVLELANKVEYEIDQNLVHRQGLLTIQTTTGVLTKKVDFPFGDVENPMGTDALVEKFTNCIRHSVKKFSEQEINRIIELVFNLEKVDNIKELTELL